jgi:hypothetical protein
MMRLALMITALAASVPAVGAAEKRCGWLHHPTPANWWLEDRDGQWILASQGGDQVPGMEDMPDMSTRGWVKTNGYYGYGCACLTVETDRKNMRIKRVLAGSPLPLRQCRADRRLPRP